MISKDTIKICGNRILVKQLSPTKKTGSIILTDFTQDQEEAVQNKGQVIIVGGSCFTSDYFLQYIPDEKGELAPHLPEPRVKEGDFILYNKYAGTQFKLANGYKENGTPSYDTYRLVSDRDVMMVFETKEAIKAAKTFYASSDFQLVG